MANGTTVAASVYYSDTTTYTGNAGSETNPYCIEDLYDLIKNPYINTQPNSEDLYYYYIVVNDIDMNDYDDYKYSPPLGISLYIKKIDFKNHELRNITIYNNNNNNSINHIFKVRGRSTSTSIHNLKLTNFISYNSSVTIFIMYNDVPKCKFYFYNCNFSIYADTTLIPAHNIIGLVLKSYNIYSQDYYSSYVYCYNCIFNIKANLSSDSIIEDSYLYMYYSHIHLYIVKNLYSLIGTIGTFTSSYITGDIYGSTCYKNSLIISDMYVFSNSYINVNFHNTNPENPTPIYGRLRTTGSCGSAFFINKSKLEGFTARGGNIANYYELTDEECKDVNKLQEIGFLAYKGGE